MDSSPGKTQHKYSEGKKHKAKANEQAGQVHDAPGTVGKGVRRTGAGGKATGNKVREAETHGTQGLGLLAPRAW